MIGRRAVARVLDAGVPLLLVVVGPAILTRVTGLSRAGAGVVAGLVAVWTYWLYETVLTARSGQTIGKRLMALRVADREGRPPDLRAAAARALPLLFLVVPVFWLIAPVAYGWAAFSSDRRGLHDLASGTRVVGVPIQKAP